MGALVSPRSRHRIGSTKELSMSTDVCGVCGEPADANEVDPHGHFSSVEDWASSGGGVVSPSADRDSWCDSLYFPNGRRKLVSRV